LQNHDHCSGYDSNAKGEDIKLEEYENTSTTAQDLVLNSDLSLLSVKPEFGSLNKRNYEGFAEIDSCGSYSDPDDENTRFMTFDERYGRKCYRDSPKDSNNEFKGFNFIQSTINVNLNIANHYKTVEKNFTTPKIAKPPRAAFDELRGPANGLSINLTNTFEKFPIQNPKKPKEREPCNCKKSQCLKLYCPCFNLKLHC
jgi:hypothetical protein